MTEELNEWRSSQFAPLSNINEIAEAIGADISAKSYIERITSQIEQIAKHVRIALDENVDALTRDRIIDRISELNRALRTKG